MAHGDGLVHGFSDDAATRALLRSEPPRVALEWAGSVLDSTVVSATALRGGISSAMHLLVVVDGADARTKVVLRRYVRPDLNVEEPELPAREALALEYVKDINIPTPELLGIDPKGSQAGVPAVLMSYLEGRVDWWPSDIHRWTSLLAEALAAIHEADLPASDSLPPLPPFSPYAQACYEAPVWSSKPAVWERAFEVFHGPRPSGDHVFIQRDFHPGNVLWKKGAISGVVDWQAACAGPPSIDVGHCRVNLFGYGLHVADQFKAMWERLTGITYEPWAEVVSIVGVLDVLRSARAPIRVMEVALERALGDLGT
jgi:aminoglycoside phosphotransferase (APT) family kinase protein